MPLFHPDDKSFSEIEELAVFVCITGENQRHVGFIYLDEDSLPVVCEYAWDFLLRFTNNSPNHPSWSDTALNWQNVSDHQVNKEYLCAFLIDVNNNGCHIPYGIDEETLCFDENGEYIEQSLGKGLTCASFIYQIYHSNGFPLVDKSTWNERDDDAIWHTNIIHTLERQGVADDRISAMRQDIGCVRVRPEEVSSASILDSRPANYEECYPMANEILELLESQITQ